MQAELDGIPFNGWQWGGTGIGSFTLSDFSRWVQGNSPASSVFVGNVGVFADYSKDRIFVNNTLELKAGYQRLGIIDIPGQPEGPDAEWVKNLDELFFSSLGGYKFTDVWAATALFDFRSSWLENFADPGQFSLGVGITYKPNDNFLAGFHPISLQGTIAKSTAQKIANEIENNLDDSDAFGARYDIGAKLFYDWNQQITDDLLFYSNLNAFAPYSDFNNYNITWVNGLGYTLGKYITITAEYGLRYYEPEQTGFFADQIYPDGVPDGTTISQIEAEPGFNGDEWQRRFVLGIGFSTNFAGNRRF